MKTLSDTERQEKDEIVEAIKRFCDEKKLNLIKLMWTYENLPIERLRDVLNAFQTVDQYLLESEGGI